MDSIIKQEQLLQSAFLYILPPTNVQISWTKQNKIIPYPDTIHTPHCLWFLLSDLVPKSNNNWRYHLWPI